MKYREYRPAEPLSGFVDCLWVLETNGGAGAPFQRIPPDGSSEVILQFAGRNEMRRSGRVEIEPPAFLLGQQRRPLELRTAAEVRNLGIRFRPGGLYRFLPVPMNHLLDQVIPLADVWPDFEKEIFRRVAPDGPVTDVLRLAEQALLARYRPPGISGRIVPRAVQRLAVTSGRISIRELAGLTGWSTRQLERRFQAEVGVGPKMLSRILRFHGTVRTLVSPHRPVHSWADLAFSSGYSDQAHLIREFRELSGTTPGQFLNQAHPVVRAILSGSGD